MKKTKKRELKEGYKIMFNIIIILLNYYVIDIMFKAIRYYNNDGIYNFKYMLLVMLMLFCSSEVLKRINFTRK